MKRILIFSLTHHPLVTGCEVSIDEITSGIKTIKFDMVTLRFDRSWLWYERVHHIDVFRVGFNVPFLSERIFQFIQKTLFPFLAYLKARRLHKLHHYDAVWSVMANQAGFAALIFKWMNPYVPYILTLQESESIERIVQRHRFVLPIFRKVFTKADVIQPVSSYLGQLAGEMKYQGPLEIIPNGVHVKLFSRDITEPELQEVRREVKKRSATFELEGMLGPDTVLVTVSRLEPKNAVYDIIMSLKHLPSNVRLLVVGIGSQMGFLKDCTESEGLSERVIFTGFVDHAQLVKYLKVSDIFIRSSLSEGFGNSFIEAMASKIPVIATPVGGVTDFICDADRDPQKNPTGVFCELHNPKSIAKQVERLMNDDRLRTLLVSNAYRMVCKKYDWNVVVPLMREKVFDRVINKARKNSMLRTNRFQLRTASKF